LFEKRTRSTDPYLAEMLGVRNLHASRYVSEDAATAVPAVHACVQLIAESVASLPLAPYKRQSDGSKRLDTDHPLYGLLHDQSNAAQTAFEFREQLVAACLLTGNGYAIKRIDSAGQVRELLPVNPSMVTVEKLRNGRLRYKIATETGTKAHTQDEVLHLRYRSKDGVHGISPLRAAATTLQANMAASEHIASFFQNMARPSGVIETDQQLTGEQNAQLRERWEEHSTGVNSGGVPILGWGLKWKPLSLSATDAQLIETLKLTVEDIARIFRVPTFMIGVTEKTSYNNATEMSRALVTHCLRPWLVRIEQAMNASLLSEDGKRTHVIEHNAEGLLRGDIKTRYEAYRIGREWGWLSPNEIRSLESMGGIEGGDEYLRPMNQEPVGESTTG
jgi:HK97 family phage portal protein